MNRLLAAAQHPRRQGVTMDVFLSHISEEALEARAIKEGLEKAFPGADVFVSAVDIHLGEAWLRQIDDALSDARVVMSLCSPNSVRRSWLNFESGSGWSRRLPVIPICHKGMRKERLPDPMRIFQAIELTSTDSCMQLVRRLANVLETTPAEDFDPADMLRGLAIVRPPRGDDVGIDLCHRQGEWDDGDKSVFALTESLPAGLVGDWPLRALTDERIFLSPELHRMSGLILGNPWRAMMTPETVAAVVEWVRSGGRLLLLGFELGDRHHDGNLAELSHHFGIDPASDIVGPPGHGVQKPYDVPVDFAPDAAEEHPFTKNLTNVRLANVQTVRVDPGGTEWLRVGNNVVYRPRRESVRYRDGTMTAPGGTAFQTADNVGNLAIAVEAPQGLCGAGGVHMMGTWDIVGRHRDYGPDNLTLVSRILDWLSRRHA